MADVFISYKHERRAAADHMAEVLSAYGYSVWWDQSLMSGRDFGAQIERELRASKAVLVLWCARATQSEWVREEAALAKRLDKVIPTIIEEVELPLGFTLSQTLDLGQWDGAPGSGGLATLLREVGRLVGRTAQPNRESLERVERAWRGFGAPSLRAFALADAGAGENSPRLTSGVGTAAAVEVAPQAPTAPAPRPARVLPPYSGPSGVKELSFPRPRAIRDKKLSVLDANAVVIGVAESMTHICIDGDFYGTVRCSALTIGETGRLHGLAVAESCVVRGVVNGDIRARRVQLERNARVTGDIWHQSLNLDKNSVFEGEAIVLQDPLIEPPASSRPTRQPRQYAPPGPNEFVSAWLKAIKQGKDTLGRKLKRDPGAITSTSVLCNGLRIEGVFITTGALELNGEIKGSVYSADALIGDTGLIEGDVWGLGLDIEGRLQGAAFVHFVDLRRTATVMGDVAHEQVSTENGAVLEGRLIRTSAPLAGSQ